MSQAARVGVELALYTVVVLLVGSLAAFAVHRWFDTASSEFPELVLRCTEIAGLGCVLGWLVLKRRLGRRWWGLVGGWRSLGSDLGVGFAIGSAMIALVVTALVVLDARVLTDLPGPGALAVLLLKGAIVGLAVALVEELWFRGGLFAALLPASYPTAARGQAPADELTPKDGATVAIVITSVLFAAVHFIEPPRNFLLDAPGPLSGFEVLAASFGRFAEPSIVAPALALGLAGLGAALARWRSGRLAPCVGLHVGWVCWLYVSKKTTELTPGGATGVLAAGYDGVIGGLAIVVFSLGAVVIERTFRSRGRWER